MSFDPESIKRLRDLRRTLPQPLLSSRPKKQVNTNSNLHPVETEKNPQKLFKELIKASPDGKIPSHLIKRLREIESFNSGQEDYPTSQTDIDFPAHDTLNQPNNKTTKSSKQINDLYISFKKLLLEED